MELQHIDCSKHELRAEEYQDYYNRYLDLLPSETKLDQTLNSSRLIEVFSALDQVQQNYRYAQGKWTPKQILQHITDVERLFAARALRISRSDLTELPGFDINLMAEMDNSSQLSLDQLISDYKINRKATISLFESLSVNSLTRVGQASGGPFSVRVIPFILLGHEIHHLNVLSEYYGI